jgi:hypothetical protein
MKLNLSVAFLVALATSPAFAAGTIGNAPPPAPYQKVSQLVKLPDFLPGLGTLPCMSIPRHCLADPSSHTITGEDL